VQLTSTSPHKKHHHAHHDNDRGHSDDDYETEHGKKLHGKERHFVKPYFRVPTLDGHPVLQRDAVTDYGVNKHKQHKDYGQKPLDISVDAVISHCLFHHASHHILNKKMIRSPNQECNPKFFIPLHNAAVWPQQTRGVLIDILDAKFVGGVGVSRNCE